jgi:Pyridoxamine 5'-phosphate oxidase
MATREPVETKNLDRYGDATLPWSRPLGVLDRIEPSELLTWFLGTVRRDGRPHAAGVGALWHDGELYFTSGPGTQKSRDLAANPAATVSVHLDGIDLVFEGSATRVTDRETLERIAGVYRKGGWPVEVEGDAFTAPFSAPSAGPPPWYLYRLDYETVFGVASVEPNGATRWRFTD